MESKSKVFYKKLVIFAIAAILSLSALALLPTASADWPDHKMHFPQLPDENGWDISATFPVVLADDWKCSETGWVKDIHFWGSWYDNIEGPLIGFWISIHSDIPAVPPNPSMPGEILWYKYIPISDIVVTPMPPSLQGFYDPFENIFYYDNHELWYQYDILLDESDWFYQEFGNIYWLDISADVPGAMWPPVVPPHWGWKSTNDHWNDDAFFGCYDPPYPGPIIWLEELHEPSGLSLDLAFVITGDDIPPSCADTVWVDDDADPSWYNFNHVNKIQTAVDRVCECGTVYVLPGTYVEQVTIRDKSLKLLGTDATIQMPSSGVLDIYLAESSSHYKYLVGIWGYDYYSGGNDTIWGPSTITVEMSGFTLDANDYPPGSGYRFASVLCRNVNTDHCDGIANIHDNDLININVDGRETFGILGYGNMDIVIQDNLIDQFGRGGIGMYSGYAEVIGNRVIGPSDLVTPITWAPNGIQLGYGASGLIDDNEVSNCGWPGTSWSGTSIMVVDTSNVDVTNNYVHDSEQAIGVVDFPECLYGSTWAGVVSDVTVTSNTLEDNEWGIAISNDVSNVLVQYNDITDTMYDAIDVYTYDPCVTSPPDDIVITYNNIVGSGADGLWIGTEVTDTVDATCNWWGDISGPSGDGPGTGDTIVGNAIYCPWLDGAYPGGTCYGGAVCRNVDTGEIFCCIQCAIDDPDTNDLPGDHDTIEVFDGVHYGNLVVDKSLTLTLDPVRAPTVIDGGGLGFGFLIKAPNVVIDGFEIRNCQIGIRTFGGPANYQDLTIQNCEIHSNTQNGILVVHDTFDDMYIHNCYIHDNGQNGIGMGNTATITNLWVDDTTISSSGQHNMYFSNVNIQGISLVEVDLTNAVLWTGMCFNTQASTIGSLYMEGGTIANNNEVGLCINQAPSQFGQIWLNDVDFTNNGGSAVLLGGGTTAQNLKVEYCTFAGNGWEDFDLSGGWYGAFNSPSVLFEHNEFYGSAWCSVYIGDLGNMPSITLFENNFYNPSLYAIVNYNPTMVQATCNYYGHNTGPRHSSMPTCTQGRIVYGNAIVKPYLISTWPGGLCVDPVIADPDGPYTGNVGQTISFTGSATGGQSPYTSWYWTFGDGGTSTLQNPTYNYWTAGFYPVTLIVTDSLGLVSCVASTSATIVPVGTQCEPEVWVDDEFTTSTPGWQVTHFALLQFALDAVCPGGIVHVYPGDYSQGVNYYTASTDGVTIIGENIPDTFDVTQGNSAIIGLPLHITGNSITVNYLVFTPSSTGAVLVSGDNAIVQHNKFLRGCLSNPIGIENQGQNNLDARFNWWGRPDGPSGNTLDANTGRIADGLGVKIVNNGPILFDPWAGIDAVATASATAVETGESILFNSVDSFAAHLDGTSNDFDVFWDFGDGYYSFEKLIAHVYAAPGTYEVLLRIQSQDPELWGEFMYDWDYITITVTIPGAPLDANADGNNLGGYETTVDETIQLYGIAVGGTQPYTYNWDLGDGTNSNEQNPTHIYKDTGTYTATLTVTDNIGDTATDTTEVTVYDIDELVVNIVIDKNTITGTENIFTATVTGGTEPYSYSWEFGDGITSTDQNPSHIYEETGTYTVTLTVTDNDNNKVSDSAIITVEEGESDIVPAEIKQVAGGFGVKATIAAGNTDCDWTINVDGNFVLIDGEASGNIQSNNEETVKLPLTFAFGKVRITVTANEIQQEYTAFAIGPFYLNVKEV